MAQLSNKIQIPIKIKIAAWLMIFFSLQWLIADVPLSLVIGGGYFLSAILLFSRKRMGWYLGLISATLDIINSTLGMFRAYKGYGNIYIGHALISEAIYMGKVLILFNLIILLLLFLDRKNYFAAVEKGKDKTKGVI